MMKTKRILTIAFALASCCCQGQNLQEIIQQTYSYQEEPNFNWGKWRIDVPEDTLISMIIKIPGEPLMSLVKANPQQQCDYFTCLDINHDGLRDLAYYGNPNGTESYFLILYLNVNSDFHIALKTHGRIIKFNENDGFSPLDVSVYQYGCCGNDIDDLINYAPVIDNDGGISYRIQSNIVFCADNELPSKVLSNPIPFLTTQPQYTLRYSTIIDNESENIDGENKGNVLAIYPKGSTGIAYAEKTDETGRVWWYVKMNNNLPPIESRMRGLEDVQYSSCGWMSSRFLEKTWE